MNICDEVFEYQFFFFFESDKKAFFFNSMTIYDSCNDIYNILLMIKHLNNTILILFRMFLNEICNFIICFFPYLIDFVHYPVNIPVYMRIPLNCA